MKPNTFLHILYSLRIASHNVTFKNGLNHAKVIFNRLKLGKLLERAALSQGLLC